MVVIRKGEVDALGQGSNLLFCDRSSSDKRISGQGDILTGILSALISVTFPVIEGKNRIYVAALACEILRLAANLSYQQNKFSLTTSEILKSIHESSKIVFNRYINDTQKAAS